VLQVRKAATVVSNVVTYTVIVSAANPDLTLLPGMTANVRIVTAQKDSVLKVANAALRFKPENDATKVSRGDTPPKGSANRNRGQSRIWVIDESGAPKALPVQAGITDGTATEIISGDVAEGMEVIVGATAPAKAGAPGGPRMF
jgi:HlyD family secretion protein